MIKSSGVEWAQNAPEFDGIMAVRHDAVRGTKGLIYSHRGLSWGDVPEPTREPTAPESWGVTAMISPGSDAEVRISTSVVGDKAVIIGDLTWRSWTRQSSDADREV